MNAIIDSVMASRRLKIFTAYYAMIYVIINLLLSLVNSSVPFFATDPGKIVYKLVAAMIQAPFIYGLVRGIVTKDYKVSAGLSAFAEVKNFGAYFAYVAVTLAYELINMLIGSAAAAEGGNQTVLLVISAIVALLRFIINFFLVKMYFDSIDNEGRPDLGRTVKGCVGLLTKRPLKLVWAELFMFIASCAVTVISVVLAQILPKHWVVGSVIACLNSVQYGFIILSWPVYYLYYKASFEE